MTTENPLSPCIVCLNVSTDKNEPLITYKGSCKCSPKIHTTCLNLWFEKNNRTCPICRVVYTPLRTAVEEPNNDGCICCCLTTVLVLVFLPCCTH